MSSSETIDLLHTGVFAHIRQVPVNIPAEAPTEHADVTPVFGPAPGERDPTFIMGQASAFRVHGIDDKIPPGGAVHAIAPMLPARTYLGGLPLPANVGTDPESVIDYVDQNLYYVGNTAPDTTSTKSEADFQMQISGACAMRVDYDVAEGQTLVFTVPKAKHIANFKDHGTYLQRQNATAPLVGPLDIEFITGSFSAVVKKATEGLGAAELATRDTYQTRARDKSILAKLASDKSAGKLTRSKERQVGQVFDFIESCMLVADQFKNFKKAVDDGKQGTIKSARRAFLKQVRVTASIASSHYLDQEAKKIGRAATPSEAGGAVLGIMR